MSRSKQIAVSRQFADDFEAVAARYHLRELGEYEQAKEAARRDMESAEVCFSAIAAEEALCTTCGRAGHFAKDCKWKRGEA